MLGLSKEGSFFMCNNNVKGAKNSLRSKKSPPSFWPWIAWITQRVTTHYPHPEIHPPTSSNGLRYTWILFIIKIDKMNLKKQTKQAKKNRQNGVFILSRASILSIFILLRTKFKKPCKYKGLKGVEVASFILSVTCKSIRQGIPWRTGIGNR